MSLLTPREGKGQPAREGYHAEGVSKLAHPDRASQGWQAPKRRQTAVPDNTQIKDRLSLLPALKCASQAPPKPSVAQVQIQVVRLKART